MGDSNVSVSKAVMLTPSETFHILMKGATQE